MFDMPPLPIWAAGEEVANSLTHLIGALMSLFIIVSLYYSAKKTGDRLKIIGNVVFGASMLTMYLTSTVYHGVANEFTKKILRYGDHISIFLLIAGSYTPFTLTVLRDSCGFLICSLIWTMALIGIVSKILFFEGFEKVSLYFFIMMGWVILFAMKNLVKNLPLKGLFWLLSGGLLYTIGCFFYSSIVPYYHAIWHAFVIAGSFCHYICVLCYT